VEEITDQNGDARSTYGYTAYGKNDAAQFTGIDKPDPANPDDPNKEPYNVYRFNAKRFDQATGDYDMGFRDYDPGLNRFLARDAYQGALADLSLAVDPFTQNRYAFAGGNPISNIELDGHIDVSWGEFTKNLTDFVGGFVSAGSEAFQGVSWWTFDSLVGMSPFVDDQTHAEAMDRQRQRGEALSHPSQLWNNMTAGYREDIANGNDARVAGRAVFDLSTLLVPGGAATKTSRFTAAGAAQTRAAAAKAALPASLSKKTVAAVGGKKTLTLSGWGDNAPAGFTRVDPAQTLAHEAAMGHKAVAAGARDQGVVGRYFASHGERQAAMLHPNTPIGVSNEMCPRCVTWFQDQATYMGREQVVADPFILRVFRPGGEILEFPR
jgi:RHS repeat-associated protein